MAIDKEKRNRIISLFLLIFQGFGLRIFDGIIPGAIVIWTLLIGLLSYKRINTLPFNCWLRFFLFLSAWIIFNILIKDITPAFFLSFAWLSSIFVFSNYWDGKNSFVDDIEIFTRICVYYTLLHIPVLLLFDSSLIATNIDMHPTTFLYLFWFSGSRVQGFCWEPSCWNLVLNLNLVLTLYLERGYKQLALVIASILCVQSTTGIVVMAIIIATYYLITAVSTTIRRNIIFGAIVAVFIAPYAMDELNTKLDTGSGASRYGDFLIAQYIMEEHPWIGANLDEIQDNATALRAREEAWDVNGDKTGYMEQGMTNSFAALFVEWGLPIATMFIILMFTTPLLNGWKLKLLFIGAIILVIMGTPISRTGFFYLFIFSGFLLNKEQKENLSAQLTNPVGRGGSC